eukprot:6082695-Prymnesium_polylepis.1
MDCDGPKHVRRPAALQEPCAVVGVKKSFQQCPTADHAAACVLIHDLDGTFTGKGADSSVLARAEFMNERRADPSKFTW